MITQITPKKLSLTTFDLVRFPIFCLTFGRAIKGLQKNAILGQSEIIELS